MDSLFALYIVVGFVAQIVDGALGMAYGVISTTFLLSLGIPPAHASASVHTAEIFTTGVSGLSHLRLRNTDRRLFQRLVVPGVLGAVLGAYLLTAVPGERIKPFVALYLLMMGLVILSKVVAKPREQGDPFRLNPGLSLGFFGGFLDAGGGGGWGPIVTSTLVARGHNARLAIGSTNLAEFFVTVAAVATFIGTIGLAHWQVIFGLLIGGVIAAPLAAVVCRRLSPRILLLLVGLVVVALSARNLYVALSP